MMCVPQAQASVEKVCICSCQFISFPNNVIMNTKLLSSLAYCVFGDIIDCFPGSASNTVKIVVLNVN